MAKKLTDDKKLAEIFPPDDLLEYDAWEAAAPLINDLKGFIDPDPATEEAIAQGKVRERARRATETQEATPVAKLDLRGRRDPLLVDARRIQDDAAPQVDGRIEGQAAADRQGSMGYLRHLQIRQDVLLA